MAMVSFLGPALANTFMSTNQPTTSMNWLERCLLEYRDHFAIEGMPVMYLLYLIHQNIKTFSSRHVIRSFTVENEEVNNDVEICEPYKSGTSLNRKCLFSTI